MKWGVALIALAIAGCATTGVSSAPTPAWLVGTWLLIDDGIAFPLACASGLPIRYEANGEYVLFEEGGSWRLQDGQLTELALFVPDASDPAEGQIGRQHVSRVDRTGPDAFRKTLADGTLELFRRCPSG